MFLANTIVTSNTGGNCAGTITSRGGNVESADTCQLRDLSDQPATDPRLGSLADNGGHDADACPALGKPGPEPRGVHDARSLPRGRPARRREAGSRRIRLRRLRVEPRAAGRRRGRRRLHGPNGTPRRRGLRQLDLRGCPGPNKGGDSVLKVASQTTDNQRALVHFALPNVPAGCKLVGAALRLYSSAATDGRTLDVFRVASAWSESEVTWANQPATAGVSAAADSGLDFREWDVLVQTLAMYRAGRARVPDPRSRGGRRRRTVVPQPREGRGPPAGVGARLRRSRRAAARSGDCIGTPLRLSADRDSWVSEGSPTNNFGTDSTLKIKSQTGSNSRALIRFPLPTLAPGCTTVASATLRMEATSAKEGRTLRVRQASATLDRVRSHVEQPAGGTRHRLCRGAIRSMARSSGT